MKLSKRVSRVFPALAPFLLKTVGPLKHFAWRLKPKPALTTDEVTSDMVPQSLEGYTHKLFYLPGEVISFHLKALLPQNQLRLQRSVADQEWEELTTHAFDVISQKETLNEAQEGCHWVVSWQYTLPQTTAPGYYRAFLTNPDLENPAEIHFLVGSAFPSSKVAVLAPVTTWLAYNAYGGQSLYRNALGEGYVPYVSMLRPNTALTYSCTQPLQHNLRIEANIFHWFSRHFQADLYPDYYLEEHPEVFQNHQVLVLAYHAEYFSAKMYTALRELVYQQRKSLLALGGNQVYWQVRWHQNFTQVECRKNGSFFENEAERGCLWRHTPQPESQLLGAQFSEAGMGTFAPYQVLEPRHWLFAGVSLQQGSLFGVKGLDHLPICGDETDKTTWSTPASTVVLAKGLNKTSPKGSMVYQAQDPAWNGSGGGEITFTELSEKNAVLNTGSIQSGSGLGTDTVFTQLIQNFMQRYAHTSSDDTTAAGIATAPASA
ncbi:N,N-dimethylformamidase beta subunit family domain-containing protein [Rufibacter latericius]|uniref:N,N-dimethylformamidase beta subunit-like C-terminal domain-containing protein n=1 Tax=Rufibacter latericius TaxID=2487040 RepID=A0A3M9N084_9BACT|nr:N,N-dimethylformamidase beta subunit family domain-containing protein [Rufibacter latericius]RNI31201.1 hypothetical protein EFB08_01315 [Rufibacter latericius]